MITVPDTLAMLLLREGEPARAWIDGFPELADEVLAGWGRRPDGEVTVGSVAVVIPVRSPQGRCLDVAADEGIAIGGDLLSRLAIPAPPDVKRLADTTAEWEQQVRGDDQRAGHPMPGPDRRGRRRDDP